MRSVFLSLIVFLGVTQQVHAFSCAERQIEGIFNQASASPDRYVMALGHFYDARQRLSHDREKVTWRYFFEGAKATRSGLNDRVGTFVDVALVRADPQISAPRGRLRTDRKMLVFLRIEGDGYAMSVDHCGGLFVYDPGPGVIRRAMSCLRGGRCRWE